MQRSQYNGQVTIQWLGCKCHNRMVTAHWLRYDDQIAVGLGAVITVQWPNTMVRDNLLNGMYFMESAQWNLLDGIYSMDRWNLLDGICSMKSAR